MGLKSAVRCECDFCGATATAEQLPADWTAVQVEDYYEARRFIYKTLCAACTRAVRKALGGKSKSPR